MAREVNDILTQTELLENGPHGGRVGIDTFHGFGVILVKVGDVDQQLFEAPLLKQPHQTFGRLNWATVNNQAVLTMFVASSDNLPDDRASVSVEGTLWILPALYTKLPSITLNSR